MADEKTGETKKTTVKTAPRPGFNERGERVIVTLDSLKEEFGAEAGEQLYRDIGRIGGFGDWLAHASTQVPPLAVGQLQGDARAEVERLLSETPKK